MISLIMLWNASIDVEARELLYDRSATSKFPVSDIHVAGEATPLQYSASVGVPLDYQFRTNLYYMLRVRVTNVNYNLIKDSSVGSTMNYKFYIDYAGERYDTSGGYIIIPGNFINGFVVSLDLEGTVYGTGKWQVSPSITYSYTLYSLTANDLPNYQNVPIVNGLGQVEDAVNQAGDKIDKTTDAVEEQTKEQKGFFKSVLDFFGGFFGNLIDAVIGLFVPSAEDMQGLLQQLNDFFSKTFGFLYYPFEVIIQLFQALVSDGGGTSITFPGFSIMGYTVWEDISYNLADNELGKLVYPTVQTISGVLLGGWFIMYLRRFFDERFGGGGR